MWQLLDKLIIKLNCDIALYTFVVSINFLEQNKALSLSYENQIISDRRTRNNQPVIEVNTTYQNMDKPGVHDTTQYEGIC